MQRLFKRLGIHSYREPFTFIQEGRPFRGVRRVWEWRGFPLYSKVLAVSKSTWYDIL